ncbi:dehydrogenase/reductase [Mycobacterium tuberculosis]|nr:hypothetical protein BBG46_01710 [Mycobacterium tuberculosis variant caprae]CEJ50537.1 Putative dehydrogenase/reductase [Mycobacterium tuberculosis variant caprae]SGA34240.1 dehydrogenase/reductase [Mycobacterium tuberculosis]SGA48870.1 dehydrogenase/reductase [Mycobacterium tuberculosis]SGO78735.1 dehydrogenase/reductase [Mycobacterium tuberculosis]
MNTGTAVITGASSGLGLQCARALLRRDASWHVVLAVRDPARGRAAMEELGEPNRCSVLEVDLASVRSVRSFELRCRPVGLPQYRRAGIGCRQRGQHHLGLVERQRAGSRDAGVPFRHR